MKKLYFIALFIFAGFSITTAQTLNQNNHAPAASDMYDMFQNDSTISPGPSGLAVTWNFTASSRTTVVVSNSCAVSTSTLYPAGSIARSTGTTNTSFYTSTATQLNFWGGNIKVATIAADYVFSPAAIHATYPMNYGTTSNNTFTGTVSSGTLSGTLSNGTSSVSADGYGTLQLPTRTFTNVLRVNTITKFNFSISIATGTVTQTSYEYFSTLTKYPLFTISKVALDLAFPLAAQSNTTNLVFVNRDYQYVGIAENSSEVSELNLFPNPASNNFNLIFVNENADQVSVEITNALGQKVKKVSLENTKGVVNHNVDITNIEAGVYFVKVNVGPRSSVKKLTIQ